MIDMKFGKRISSMLVTLFVITSIIESVILNGIGQHTSAESQPLLTLPSCPWLLETEFFLRLWALKLRGSTRT